MSHNNHYVGASSEFLVAAYLSSLGNDVFFPNTPSRADLIYTPFGGNAVRVQVKTTTRSRTGPFTYEQCRLIRKNGGKPYEIGEVDEVYVIGTHLWMFPISVVAGKSSLCLLGDGPRHGGYTKGYKADDFIILRGEWDRPFRDIMCHSA